MRRSLLLLPVAALLMNCGGTAIKPQPGHTSAGTNAGSGSNSTGSTGTTASTTTTGTNATTGGSTSASSTTTSAGSSGSTGATNAGTTSSGSTGATNAGTSGSGSTGATNAGTSGSGSTGASNAGTSGSGSTGASSAGSGSSGGSTGTPATAAFVRFANFVVGALGASDFCLQQQGQTNATGPVIASYQAGVNGLSYGDVSLYIPVDDPTGGAGTQYTLLLLLPGATDCSAPVGSANLSVSTGTHFTVVSSGSVGAGGATINVMGYVDDVAAPSDPSSYRFVHSSPAPTHQAVDFGKGTGPGNFQAVFDNVAYQESSQGKSNTDPNGYRVDPNAATSANFAVRNHGGTQLFAMSTVTLAGAQTVFLTGAGTNIALVTCPDDGVQAQQGTVLATCQ